MTTVDTFPDAEAVVGSILRNGITGARVYSSIPKKPTYPLITVRRYGGTPVTRMRLDAADVQVDVWGESKSAARLLAAQARVALYAAEASTVTVSSGNAYVTGVTDVAGLLWLPDPSNPPIDHYTFTVRVFLHAA